MSASDVGAYAYCGRMYWLQKVAKMAPNAAGAARFARGTAGHASHGTRVRFSRGLARAAVIAIVAAGILVAALWVLQHLTTTISGSPAVTP